MSDPGPAPPFISGNHSSLYVPMARQGCATLYNLGHGSRAEYVPPAATTPARDALAANPMGRRAYVQPSRRATDGRYGENPNRLAALLPVSGADSKPSRPICKSCTFGSSEASGSTWRCIDIRFVEDDWEKPDIGAWVWAGKVWCEYGVSQFTYSAVGRVTDWAILYRES